MSDQIRWQHFSGLIETTCYSDDVRLPEVFNRKSRYLSDTYHTMVSAGWVAGPITRTRAGVELTFTLPNFPENLLRITCRAV